MPAVLKFLRIPLLALSGALLLWSIVAWPLPMMMDDTISISPRAPQEGAIIRMFPGDHLQLLYQLWLGHDTFFGSTPWSSNLYEFNTGNDADRVAYSTYYFPFNFFFSIGYVIGGPAVGMNMAAILSLAVAVGATALWLRRWFPHSPWIVICGTLVGQLLPYRWHALLHGSPTGLAMMWVPVLLLGMDIWLREYKARGAALAGAAVFFSGWSDTHALFFTGVLAPVWVIPNLLAAHRILLPTKDQLLRVIKTSWPLFIWAGLTVWQILLVRTLTKGTNVEEGRAQGEVYNFARDWSEVYSADSFGGWHEIYLGPLFIALLTASAVALLWKSFRKQSHPRTPALLLAGLTIALLVISLVATGPKHPMGLIWWQRTLRILPPLSMLRQPSKVYLLLPPFLSLMFGLGIQALPKAWIPKAAPILTLLIGFTFVARLTPHLCVLDERNDAYHAVSQDAETPRALVLPLWPGDSHLSSVYTYYAMQEHLRLVNGYRPSLNLTYFDDIFLRFQTLNQGDISNDKLDALTARGITHVILHENAFPEKVSPFSVGYTLKKLLTHSRLELLEQAGPVYAFRILSSPRTDIPVAPPWQYWGTVRAKEAEHATLYRKKDGDGSLLMLRELELDRHEPVNPEEVDILPADRVESPVYSGGAAARITADGLTVKQDLSWLTLQDPRTLFIRAGGNGVLDLRITWGDLNQEQDLILTSETPKWYSLPAPSGNGTHIFTLEASTTNETPLFLDTAMVGPPTWTPEPEKAVELYPTAFFHAGHTRLETNEVHFLPERDPATRIFYGPSLPLTTGTYEVELVFSSSAPTGTGLGRFQLRNQATKGTDVVSGSPARFRFDHPGTQLFSIEFDYAGSAPIQLQRVRLMPVR